MAQLAFQIRPATAADLPRIAALHAESWQAAYAGEFPKARLEGEIREQLLQKWAAYQPQPGDILLLAEHAGTPAKLLGFCAVWCRPEPYLDNLHVSPAAQGLGTGSALFRAAVRQLLAQGQQSLSLTVFQSNQKARAFYAGLQGTETGELELDVFGTLVPSVTVVWPDLSRLKV